MADPQGRLDFDAGDPLEARDAESRRLAVDPTRNVALEASAGTGKTRVLVDRYVGLLASGVKPRNILAITFTRKAAAEMRQRILQELSARHRAGTIPPALWREIRDSVADVSISTIDAFCFALLREFPLEADVDPAFELADETETPRLVDEALERTLRIGRGLAADAPEMALVFAELGEYRLREGLARLIDRRLVAAGALARVQRGAPDATIDEALSRLHHRLRAAFSGMAGGVPAFIATGPARHEFTLVAQDLQRLVAEPAPTPAATQALLERVSGHLLTQEGAPRKRLTYKKADFRTAADYERHLSLVTATGPYLVEARDAYRADLNRVLARVVGRLFRIAVEQYRLIKTRHGLLDFTDVLERTLALLGQMDEFSRSRFKLESRYHHVLVDEFQDTSRAQWMLVERLVRSWAAGLGVTAHTLEPSIFIVGDRKQSIYAFRDAEVSVLDEAARYIDALRPGGGVRMSITRSFRAVGELLAFVNDLFDAVDKSPERADAFRYSDDDRFPVAAAGATEPSALGLVAAATEEQQAEAVADEIAQLLASGATIRDRDTGVRRAARPGDIGILFRTRDGHRLFEDALVRRRVPFYVYKGLGFFDADEIKDVLALLSFLARPQSELHAAALLRSRVVRLSDEALKHLAPGLSTALTGAPPAAMDALDARDRRRLALARAGVASWLSLVDRLPPAELLDRVLAESAYAAEIAGPSYRQSRENLKKVRGLVRRMQNRGYATLGRVVDQLTRLVAGGDESNAVVDAVDAVNLMTIHAAKGLEFPIVFVVNLQRGSGGGKEAIRVFPAEVPEGEPAVAIGDHEIEADRDLEARDAEETKRLLYVALTRARDRLYLAAALDDGGRFAPYKGGLGRMLPASLVATIAAAPAFPSETIAWRGAGAEHRFRILRPAATPVAVSIPDPAAADSLDDFAPLDAAATIRLSATGIETLAPLEPPALVAPVAPVAPILGLLLHRALANGWLAADPAARDERALAALVTEEERGVIDDEPALIREARAALAGLRENPDIAAVYGAAAASLVWRRHEVPFSWRRPDGAIVRGVIDCLVRRPEGLEVIELKTGRPTEAHRRQLDVYVQAAREMFPGVPVSGRLLYVPACEEQLSRHPGV